MKKATSVFFAILGAISFSGITLAECPDSLSADEMVDCIVVEGAGGVHPKSVFKQTESKTKPAQVSKSGNKKATDQLAKTEK